MKENSTIALWEQEIESNIIEFNIIDFLNPIITESQDLTDKDIKEFEAMLKRNKNNNFASQLKKSSGEFKEVFGIDIAIVGIDIAKFAFSKLGENGFSQEAKDEINAYTNKKYREIAETIISNYNSIDPGQISNKEQFQKYINDKKNFSETKLLSAIELLIKVLLVSYIISNLLELIFKSAGKIMSIVLVSPIIEENSKIVAIKGDFALEYTIVFNAFEYTGYVIRYGPQNGFGKMAILRILPVGMHLTTTLIHYLSEKTTIVDKIKNPNKLSGYDTDDKDTKATLTGKFLGTLIHMVWNGTVIALSSIK